MNAEKYIKNYINGQLEPPISGQYIDLYQPALGEVYAFAPDSSAKEVEAAVEAAELAFPKWSAIGTTTRSRMLMRLADIIEQNLEAFAIAESIDTGKPVELARSIDIPRSHSNIRFFATAAAQFSSESHHMENEAINFTLRQPIGVVGCISPWNLPLYLFTWKIAPALAAGNCVIAKPSEVTPMTAFMLSKACIEAGIPPGVLNIIHGRGPEVGQAIVAHPRIKAISFTGGTNTGRQIASIAAPMFKKLSLELGGKNPNIIFADCDFDEMLATTVRSSFANQGQICLCGSRVFVQAAIYEKFKTAFVEQVKKLNIGDPMSNLTNIGAVVSAEHREKVLSYITLAQEEGGTVLCGGAIPEMEGKFANGYFLQPTVIEGLAYDCRTNQEEIFGPVVTIMPFETEEEVLNYANSVEYGLSATIWTKDISRANRMAERIQAGVVWINCWLLRDLRTPFGGTKASGVGREGGMEAMRFFTEAKNVCIKY